VEENRVPERNDLKQHRGSNLANLLVANVHVLALPGSQRYAGGGIGPVIERAVAEARIADEAGFDAVLLQNAGDGVFQRDGDAATIAHMAAVGAAVKAAIGCRLGINILAVGQTASIAIASALDADFVRIKVYVGAVVTPTGLEDGSYEEALEYRRRIGAERVPIVADVFDRSSWALGDWSIEEAARHARGAGGAELLVITGRSVEESLRRTRDVKAALPDVAAWCGGGSTPDNIGQMLEVYDGAIVGQGIKRDGDIGNSFDAELANRFVAAARP
jgi:membrane complex biogenesis BtpA family protein